MNRVNAGAGLSLMYCRKAENEIIVGSRYLRRAVDVLPMPIVFISSVMFSTDRSGSSDSHDVKAILKRER